MKTLDPFTLKLYLSQVTKSVNPSVVETTVDTHVRTAARTTNGLILNWFDK